MDAALSSPVAVTMFLMLRFFPTCFYPMLCVGCCIVQADRLFQKPGNVTGI